MVHVTVEMNTDLEMGTRGMGPTSIAQDAPDFDPAADAETANPTLLSVQQVPVLPGDAEDANTTSLPGPQVVGNGPERVGLSLPRAWESIRSLPLPWASTGRLASFISSCRGLFCKMGLIQAEYYRKDPSIEGKLKIRILHQYNVLWARSRLLRQYHEPNDIVDDEFAARTQRDLQTYCKDEARC